MNSSEFKKRKSCGCLKYETKHLRRYDFPKGYSYPIGMVFGDFKIISRDRYSGGFAYWNYQCMKCGKIYTAARADIFAGNIPQCTCGGVKQ